MFTGSDALQVSAVYHLKVLVPVTHAEDDLKVHLETTFHSMERTIKEFGR